MSLKKSFIPLILLFALILSLTGGISPALATELEDLNDEENIDPLRILLTDDLDDDDEDITIGNNSLLGDFEGEFPFEGMGFEPASLGIDPFAAIVESTDPIDQFVTRLYRNVLLREPDPSGFQFWSDSLRARSIDGASVAYGFFFSQEFINRRFNSEAFVDILYKTLMNRDADPSGRAFWLGQLNNGWPREEIFAGFVNSIEFDTLCNRAGISRGAYTPPHGLLTRIFVTRLYRIVLQREPDSSGLNFWTNTLLSGGSTGAAVANGFVFSPEMNSRNLSNDAFVEVLYNAFMGRGSDPSGKAFWLELLEFGLPRENIFAGFANSLEFGNICREAGIRQGSFTPSPSGSARVFVTRLYRQALGREPDSQGLEFWTSSLVSGSTAATVSQVFLFGPEVSVQSNENFVRILYNSLLGRAPGQSDIDFWITQFNSGVPRHNAFLSVLYSPEFANVYRALGIRGLTSDSYPYGGVRPFNHFGSRTGCTGVVNQGLRHIGHHPRPNTFTRYSGMNADWCAMFTSYVFDHTGNCALHSHAQHSAAKIRSWTCTTIMNTARSQGRWADGNFMNPAPGDWILFNWGHAWNTAQHIGIVTGHDGERVFYVDGNTGGSGANMVLHQSRSLADGSIRGYVIMF